jgi:hypothetical protein
MSQHELDFVDVNNEHDLPLYVDPFAIEISDDEWSATASDHIRIFFKEVLDSIRSGPNIRAIHLMSHLGEPKETFLGVSSGVPDGKGVGSKQAAQLIAAIQQSEAFKTGLLKDLSDMALYVEGVGRDKISDLTTNVIRSLLVEYTQSQCKLHGVPIKKYACPPAWDAIKKQWFAQYVELPFIEENPVILVPKHIVRRKLCIDSQEFYNKQMTDYLVEEAYSADSSLVHLIKGKQKVYKTEVREKNPKSKKFIASMVNLHPELLETYKEIARKEKSLATINEDGPSLSFMCEQLADLFGKIPSGTKDADRFHRLAMGSLTALFSPDLIIPKKEWEVNSGRKRIDIVYTNAADKGFFSHRRNDSTTNANVIIVECKNYSNDLGNQEFDQLLGRFDDNRGKFGFMVHRSSNDPKLILQRCQDAAVRKKGYIITFSDSEMIQMLKAKAALRDDVVNDILHKKFRDLIA